MFQARFYPEAVKLALKDGTAVLAGQVEPRAAVSLRLPEVECVYLMPARVASPFAAQDWRLKQSSSLVREGDRLDPDLDRSALRVLLDSDSIAARMALAGAFESAARRSGEDGDTSSGDRSGLRGGRVNAKA